MVPVGVASGATPRGGGGCQLQLSHPHPTGGGGRGQPAAHPEDADGHEDVPAVAQQQAASQGLCQLLDKIEGGTWQT